MQTQLLCLCLIKLKIYISTLQLNGKDLTRNYFNYLLISEKFDKGQQVKWSLCLIQFNCLDIIATISGSAESAPLNTPISVVQTKIISYL